MEKQLNFAEKIENFKLLVENQDDEIAINYLQKADWDESIAANLYYEEKTQIYNPETTSTTIINEVEKIDMSKYKEIPIPYPQKINLIGSLFCIFKAFPKNDPCIDLFTPIDGTKKYLEDFILFLKNRVGIIVIYNQNNFEQIKKLANGLIELSLNEGMKDIKRVIFPIFDKSDTGQEVIKNAKIDKFPTLLLCKYKNNKNLYIIEKIADPIDINLLTEKLKNIYTLVKKTEVSKKKNNNTLFNLNKKPLFSAGDIIAQQKRDLEELERMENEKKEREKKEELEKKKKEEELRKLNEKIELIKKNLPEEPDDSNPDKTIIVFRYPDGEKNIERKFLKTHTIQILYDFVESLGREIYTEENLNKFVLIQTFPYKKYENKEKTLGEEGLYPNSVIQIKEID